MASLAHRSKVRRAERAVLLHQGNINLVPLVDILTSIVFYSLLTYTGEQMLTLTAYDLRLPPQVVPAEAAATKTDRTNELEMVLAVKMEPNQLVVEHSQEGGYRQAIPGLTATSLDQLQQLMTQIKSKYPQNRDVLVVPSDEIAYDNVIKVMERLRLANFTDISLASKSRATGTTTTVSRGGEVAR